TKEESKTAKVTKKYDMYGYVERIPLTGIRKTIANKLTTTFPQAHVTHMDEADVTHLLTLKEQAKNKKTHLTLAPFIIKATILALKKHPYLNATFNGEELIVKKYYNIGIATDTPDGLMVPVLKIADQKTLIQIAEELKILIEHAKKRKIDLADLQGSSFSITNIGSIGGTYFTPIMNPGDVAILGLGRRTEKALVLNRKIEIRNILPLSVTFDHRILDGAEVARFVNDFKQFLENPETLFR
ncbi:MAG TPA: dihydrolipoamide acetyltransferase family protein, partial [Candidatus Nanoarchaeia archaeon]|nr:dihydrolipoamide acetyltransferase family protein [Candidatus Nanoarchaeia archaeon]